MKGIWGMELQGDRGTDDREAQSRAFAARIRRVGDTDEARRDATAARQEMSLANIGLVVDIAQRYQGMGVSLEDLVSEGYVGLLEACGRYDFEKYETQFSTYATWWVRKHIIGAVKKAPLVRVPDYLMSLRHKFNKQAGKMTAASESGVPPTFEEVADLMGLSPGLRSRLHQSLLPVASISEIGGITVETTMDQVDNQDLIDVRMTANLDDRQMGVLTMRFGLGANFTTIGERFGFSRRTASTVCNTAIRRLQSA